MDENSVGIEHVEGNMFESVPTGDAIMVKVISTTFFFFSPL